MVEITVGLVNMGKMNQMATNLVPEEFTTEDLK